MPSKKHHHFFVEHLRAYQVPPPVSQLRCETTTFEGELGCMQKLGERKIAQLKEEPSIKNDPSAVRRFQDAPKKCTNTVGTTGYYKCRMLDFVYRNPTLKIPPYYPSYGNKYVQRFRFETMNSLSPQGREWLTQTLRFLQEAIEKKLDQNPAAFADLERHPEKLQAFAYETHPDAYLKAGLEKLGFVDLSIISTTPDATDIWTRLGIAQVIEVAKGLAKQKAPSK